MKPKYLLLSAALLTVANVSGASVDTDAPAYRITDKDSTCQIFVYSPAADQGLHLAYLNDDERWVDVGQLCGSDYGPWGSGKKMYRPFVTRAADGTWRALWSVNGSSPQFAVAYSKDLITWRPQDYPIVKEKGIKDVAAYQTDDGSFDIYLKTAKGKRYVHADRDFRTFKEDKFESTADDIVWQRDTATINGRLAEGYGFDISAAHLNNIRAWHMKLAEEERENSRPLPHNEAELQAYLKETNTELAAGDGITARLQINPRKSHGISDRLIGIFFEDISRAADGGLCAELLQNGDFEYNGEKNGWNATTAWQGLESAAAVATENGVSSNNPHHAILSDTPIYNTGWEGIAVQRAAYDVSLYARCMDGSRKQLTVALVDAENKIVAQAKLKVQGDGWNEYKTRLVVSDKYKGAPGSDIRFAVIPKGKGRVAVDMLSLMPHDTYKGHGLRKDLAEVIADLKPRFVRFPGGCMLHGQGLDNIYHWKESVGPQKDRKPALNIWGYHQTRKLGFYEYFQWCEDMGAEPLPVLAAGVPCQNSQPNAEGVCGQQGGIPMSEMPQYVQDVLDLVEWANGDPSVSKWAKMRADAGHPAPFNLKMVGIGNEDLISTDFEQRYLMICKALKEKHPEIEVVGTVGPFHYPSSDYIEGWKVAKENRRWIDAVDEHYYEKPGWFINHQDYYDSYDRKAPKVYLGEYAANGNNELDRALAEGIHLCNIERNGDVVEMTSYAPLLCKEGYHNWDPDMIYFDNSENIRLTESYRMQKMFGQHAGDTYIASELNLPPALKRYIGTSVVKDSKTGKTWLKVVNALPRTLRLQVSGLGDRTVEINARSSQVVEL